MASPHIRGKIHPANCYSTNLSGAHHTSHHSHMTSPSWNPSMNPNPVTTPSQGDGKIKAEDNTQNRFELFLLGDGERKVVEEADTRKLGLLSSSNVTHICYFYTRISTTRRSSSSIADSHPCTFQTPARIPTPYPQSDSFLY